MLLEYAKIEKVSCIYVIDYILDYILSKNSSPYTYMATLQYIRLQLVK